jgi:hypothetical protein
MRFYASTETVLATTEAAIKRPRIADSNRDRKLLETAVTHSKQKTAHLSNRYKNDVIKREKFVWAPVVLPRRIAAVEAN